MSHAVRSATPDPLPKSLALEHVTVLAMDQESAPQRDLLPLDADPLIHLGNSRRITAVIVGRRYLPRALLDQRVKTLMAR